MSKENVICFSGNAFNYILQKHKELKTELEENELNIDVNYKLELFNNLFNIISEACKIFFRMQPNDKVRLVNFLKTNPENIVAMCGDGANDCGALLCADVGFSINFRENSNITSHFYSKGESISCVAKILQNGRACLENTLIIIKFHSVFSVNQLLFYMLLRYKNILLTNNQYLFNDLFVSLISCLAISKTAANTKLQNQKFGSVGLKEVISITCQFIFSFGILCCNYLFNLSILILFHRYTNNKTK